MGMYLEAMAIRFLVRFVELRLFRSRIVRPVLLKGFRVLRWMRIFAAREFFEDEIQGLWNRIQVRLPRRRLDQRERLHVQSHLNQTGASHDKNHLTLRTSLGLFLQVA